MTPLHKHLSEKFPTKLKTKPTPVAMGAGKGDPGAMNARPPTGKYSAAPVSNAMPTSAKDC